MKVSASHCRVALFTDTAMIAAEGEWRPLRDQFVHFIWHVASADLELTIVSRTRAARSAAEGLGPLLTTSAHRFVHLPYYESTKDFYLRSPSIVARSWGTILRQCRRADLICLRHHHCLAPIVWAAAVLTRTPVVLYWAGPPITQSAERNFSSGFLRPLALGVASMEQAFAKRTARLARHHFFVDRQEHLLMGCPRPYDFVVPTLVAAEDLMSRREVARPRAAECQVLFAGRLVEHKGIFELLEAAERLWDEGLEFNLLYAGEGKDSERLARRAAASPHSVRVRLHGSLDHSALLDEMSRSDVFCLPSHAEGLPKVLWEAWSKGCAVVISDVGSIRHFVRDRINGLLIKAGDERCLVDALKSVVGDSALRTRLGMEGLESARRHSLEASSMRIRNQMLRVARGAAGTL